MYLLVATYAGHNFDECDLYANSHVIGAYETVEQCKEACLIDLKGIFSDLAECYVDPDEGITVEDIVSERMDSVVFNDLDDSSFARPYAERYLAEYDYAEDYGLDVIKYLVIKI